MYIPSRFKKMFLLVCYFSLVLGCRGRSNDDKKIKIKSELFGLQDNRPSVLVFGAVWCKPCRAEIEMVNSIYEQHHGAYNIRGYLVEGETKGKEPSDNSLSLFSSLDGVLPLYPTLLDANWKLFKSLSPSQGKALPLFAFIDKDGYLRYTLQRSPKNEDEIAQIMNMLTAEPDMLNKVGEVIDDGKGVMNKDSEVKTPQSESNADKKDPNSSASVSAAEDNKADASEGGGDDQGTSGENPNGNGGGLVTSGSDADGGNDITDASPGAIIEGEGGAISTTETKVPVTVEPKPPEPEVAYPRSLLVEEWLLFADEKVKANVKKSWRDGRNKFGFESSDMPFNKGIIELNLNSDKQVIPLSAKWNTDKGCYLNVILDSQGNTIFATGQCN